MEIKRFFFSFVIILDKSVKLKNSSSGSFLSPRLRFRFALDTALGLESICSLQTLSSFDYFITMFTGLVEIVRATSSTIAPEGNAKLVLIVGLLNVGEGSLLKVDDFLILSMQESRSTNLEVRSQPSCLFSGFNIQVTFYFSSCQIFYCSLLSRKFV